MILLPIVRPLSTTTTPTMKYKYHHILNTSSKLFLLLLYYLLSHIIIIRWLLFVVLLLSLLLISSIRASDGRSLSVHLVLSTGPGKGSFLNRKSPHVEVKDFDWIECIGTGSFRGVLCDGCNSPKKYAVE